MERISKALEIGCKIESKTRGLRSVCHVLVLLYYPLQDNNL